MQHQADYGDIIKTAITHCLRYSVAQTSYEWSHVLVEALKSEYQQLTEEQEDDTTVDFTSASWGDLKVLAVLCMYKYFVLCAQHLAWFYLAYVECQKLGSKAEWYTSSTIHKLRYKDKTTNQSIKIALMSLAGSTQYAHNTVRIIKR